MPSCNNITALYIHKRLTLMVLVASSLEPWNTVTVAPVRLTEEGVHWNTQGVVPVQPEAGAVRPVFR